MQIFDVWVGITFFLFIDRSQYKKYQLIKLLEIRCFIYNLKAETTIYYFYFKNSFSENSLV